MNSQHWYVDTSYARLLYAKADPCPGWLGIAHGQAAIAYNNNAFPTIPACAPGTGQAVLEWWIGANGLGTIKYTYFGVHPC